MSAIKLGLSFAVMIYGDIVISAVAKAGKGGMERGTEGERKKRMAGVGWSCKRDAPRKPTIAKWLSLLEYVREGNTYAETNCSSS